MLADEEGVKLLMEECSMQSDQCLRPTDHSLSIRTAELLR